MRARRPQLAFSCETSILIKRKPESLAQAEAPTLAERLLLFCVATLASGQNSNGSKGLSSTEASDLCADSRNACRTGVFSNGRTDKICRKV